MYYTVRDYWARVREIEKALTDDPYLMSLDDPLRGFVGGVVVQASRSRAAEAIEKKSHRLATKDEIAAHLAAENERKERAEADVMKNAGHAVFVLSPMPKPDAAAKTAKK